MLLRVARPAALAALQPPARSAPALLKLRGLCAAKKPTDDGEAATAAAAAGEKPNEAALTDSSLEVSRAGAQSGGYALQEHEGETLPPLEFEPGVAGVAQKGVSAVVIAFGAAAFGAIAWGTYMALFPGPTSTGSIYSEAFEKAQQDTKLSNALGTPLRAHGADHGNNRGRRNAMERWDIEENGEELSVVRFTVSGPQGSGVVQVQTPRHRRRGEFKYIIFETPHPRGRAIYHIYDSRGFGEAAAPPEPAPLIAKSASDSATPVPPAPAALAPAKA